MSDLSTNNIATLPIENKRGRKPGQKVASLDYRAHILLQDAELADFYAKRDDIGSRKWERDLIAHILSALRDGDDPIF